MGYRNKHRGKNLLTEFKENQTKKEKEAREKDLDENIDETTGGLLCSYNHDTVQLPKTNEDLEKFKEGAFKKAKQVKKTNIKFIF